MTIIAPSLLAANWNDINGEMKKLTHNAVKWIHFDVMDGNFVPATTYSPQQLKEVAKFDQFHFDVHLMVSNPIKQATAFANAGADSITFHIEATDNPQKVIDHIKSLNKKVGISLKPATSVDSVIPFLDQIDILLIMSVEPGKGGQGFIDGSLERISKFAKLKEKHNFLIEVDGGIKDFNAPDIIAAGADVLVAGSYIFNADDYNKNIDKMLKK